MKSPCITLLLPVKFADGGLFLAPAYIGEDNLYMANEPGVFGRLSPVFKLFGRDL